MYESNYEKNVLGIPRFIFCSNVILLWKGICCCCLNFVFISLFLRFEYDDCTEIIRKSSYEPKQKTKTSKQLKLSFCWVLWSSLLSVFPAAAWLCSVNVAWIISLRTEQRFLSFSGKYGDQFGLHCSLKPIQLWEENLILDQTASSGPDTSVRRLYKIMSSLDF